MTAPAPDPLKGIRGVYAAVLLLESIVVGLALLVLPKSGTDPVGVAVIGGLAGVMLLSAFVQRTSWGLYLALALQVITIVAGFVFVTALGVMGVVFGLVWAGILLLRRDVVRKMERGELPSQQVRDS